VGQIGNERKGRHGWNDMMELQKCGVTDAKSESQSSLRKQENKIRMPRRGFEPGAKMSQGHTTCAFSILLVDVLATWLKGKLDNAI